MTLAGLLAALALGVLALFQLGLAAGMPWGAAAWGGEHPGVLPARLRVASAVAGLVLYPIIGAVVLSAAGIIGDWLPFDPTVAMWVLAAFFALGIVMNAVSRSPIERVWSPVSALLAICCAVIALG